MITGSTGFIGAHLLKDLCAENEVFALVRDKRKAAAFPPQVHVVNGDLFESQPWPEEIECLIHLAAITKAVRKEEFAAVNHRGTIAVLDRCRRLPRLRRIVFLSSLAAAGPSPCWRGLREDEPARPVSWYGRSKLLAEEAVKRLSPVPFVIIRPPIVFGPGDLDMLTVLRGISRGFMPVLSGEEKRYSIIFVRDLVNVIKLVLPAGFENETIYAANEEPVEWRAFMAEAARLAGVKKIRFLPLPFFLVKTTAAVMELGNRLLGRKAIFNLDKVREMAHSCWLCDSGKMLSLLSYKPQTSIAAALSETIAWYRENGFLR